MPTNNFQWFVFFQDGADFRTCLFTKMLGVLSEMVTLSFINLHMIEWIYGDLLWLKDRYIDALTSSELVRLISRIWCVQVGSHWEMASINDFLLCSDWSKKILPWRIAHSNSKIVVTTEATSDGVIENHSNAYYVMHFLCP